MTQSLQRQLEWQLVPPARLRKFLRRRGPLSRLPVQNESIVCIFARIDVGDPHPVSVHIGAVNASKKAQGPVCPHQIDENESKVRALGDALFIQPVLFSKSRKASLVDTLLSPAPTRSAMMTAMLVPTALPVSSSHRVCIEGNTIYNDVKYV